MNEIVCGFQRYTFSQTGNVAESNKGWFVDGVDLRNYCHSFVEDDANIFLANETEEYQIQSEVEIETVVGYVL